jgi:hypothetical protein
MVLHTPVLTVPCLASNVCCMQRFQGVLNLHVILLVITIIACLVFIVMLFR